MSTLKHAFQVVSLLAAISAPSFAQSVVEQGKATGNDVKREVKKGGHRVGEALCTGTKAECAARKAKNRGIEAKDKVVDEGKEIKDKLDTNDR